MPRYSSHPPFGFDYGPEGFIFTPRDTSCPSCLPHSPSSLCSSYSGFFGVPLNPCQPSLASGSFVVPDGNCWGSCPSTLLSQLMQDPSLRSLPQKPVVSILCLLIYCFILLYGLYLHPILQPMLIC